METRVGGKNDYIWHLSVLPPLGSCGNKNVSDIDQPSSCFTYSS